MKFGHLEGEQPQLITGLMTINHRLLTTDSKSWGPILQATAEV